MWIQSSLVTFHHYVLQCKLLPIPAGLYTRHSSNTTVRENRLVELSLTHSHFYESGYTNGTTLTRKYYQVL